MKTISIKAYWYSIERLKVRPGSFVGHILLLYHNFVTVSIPSNRSLLGKERVTKWWYSVPRLLEPMSQGRRGSRMRGARVAVGGVAAKFLR